MNTCQEKKDIDCGKQDNNTLNGKCRCEECSKKTKRKK